MRIAIAMEINQCFVKKLWRRGTSCGKRRKTKNKCGVDPKVGSRYALCGVCSRDERCRPTAFDRYSKEKNRSVGVSGADGAIFTARCREFSVDCCEVIFQRYTLRRTRRSSKACSSTRGTNMPVQQGNHRTAEKSHCATTSRITNPCAISVHLDGRHSTGDPHLVPLERQ